MSFMGDEELRAESPADAFFRGCCMKESVNDFCTNKMCSLSRIAGMTHWTLDFIAITDRLELLLMITDELLVSNE
ncbi:unnamed protein product [Brugia pahangi]|uniref:Uncharacterized protein n=1 Tax=Brugia pahangi TaxID=6280 RepID=A0A0N4T6A0_BRUPA|nr:unnamed protein product [Brugia pahangi]